jgi:hypothetical protein
MGTITVFDDSAATPNAEIALAGGDRVTLTLERGRLVIRDVTGGKVIYEARPDVVSEICVSMTMSRDPIRASPLKLLASLVSRMPSAAEVTKTFRAAEAAISQ